ncbi:ABC transporter ATP-binding protein [Herbihabitans rhizosphaerae]|uniref:ABC transporter ATP-binding protein n=1 Tax=Herbihabitans rhizosphaerae TaxID=1872711 RepID=UPI00102B8869|nr:ATP-binding cassette domain-containing protein [Herbihabitans rhizosphaerae]
MIEIRELTKRYGPAVAVDGLTFDVAPGRVTGFLGPNGAGKSTTMRMLLGLDHPSGGRALLGGRPYRELREPLRIVGALLEARSTHGGRTAYHHLLWLAATNRIPRRRVDEVLGLVGLESAAGKRAGTFSLGMSQRLGIAAALLGDPEIVLLDEPVNGLDPEGVRWIRTLMKDLAAEGRTVLVSSHLMSEMAITADHLIVIGQGRLLADTTVDEFVAASRRGHVRVSTPEADRLAALLDGRAVTVRRVDGALEITGMEAGAVGAVAGANGIALDELSTRSSSLEDAFLELTAGSTEYSSRPQAEEVR